MMDLADQREQLIAELNEIVDAMADHLSFTQAARLAILVTVKESQILAYAWGPDGEFLTTVDDDNRVWYCGKRVMVEEKLS